MTAGELPGPAPPPWTGFLVFLIFLLSTVLAGPAALSATPTVTEGFAGGLASAAKTVVEAKAAQAIKDSDNFDILISRKNSNTCLELTIGYRLVTVPYALNDVADS
jgi:hypothetical protein